MDSVGLVDASTIAVPAMTPGRASLIELVRRYLEAMVAPFVTLLEIHKLMYFLQEAGEPLRLRFVKAPHGPYAENLSHVLKRIEEHFLYGYLDGGDAPYKPLNLVPHAVEDAESFLFGCPETRSRIAHVVALCDGFESPFDLELLALACYERIGEERSGRNGRIYQVGGVQVKIHAKARIDSICATSTCVA